MLDPNPNLQGEPTHAGARLLKLDLGDNIAVATADIPAGTAIIVEGTEIRMERNVPTGHKVAIRKIAAGEKIVKYRVPIGSAIVAIEPGDYVHVHNLKSDYIATYTLDGARKGARQ